MKRTETYFGNELVNIVETDSDGELTTGISGLDVEEVCKGPIRELSYVNDRLLQERQYHGTSPNLAKIIQYDGREPPKPLLVFEYDEEGNEIFDFLDDKDDTYMPMGTDADGMGSLFE